MRALLIQKDVKLKMVKMLQDRSLRALLIQKDVKLSVIQSDKIIRFESFVNSERCKTRRIIHVVRDSLRALLIQKDVKLCNLLIIVSMCLRALLIQKDVKR